MSQLKHGSPGSHPHSDRPNWQPATTFEDYMRNCREGLEQYSERRLAKLLGMTRASIWRAKLMANIPDDLFDRLCAEGRGSNSTRVSEKSLAQVGKLLSGDVKDECECCPHCGGLLRIRAAVPARLAKIVLAWLEEQRAARRAAA